MPSGASRSAARIASTSISETATTVMSRPSRTMEAVPRGVGSGASGTGPRVS